MSIAKIVTLAACVALASWFVWTRATRPPLPVALPSVSRAEAPAPVEAELAPAQARTPAVSATAPAPPAEKKTAVAPARGPEPNAKEVALLEVETPPGTIEGLVLVGREPLTTGGLVFFHHGYFTRLPERPRDAAPEAHLQSAVIDGQGLFKIRALEPGDYTLAVDLGQGAQHETTVNVSAEKPGRRIVIVLGTARVEGHIYDIHGAPVAGARVSVDVEFLRKSAGTFRTARASLADGSYAISNLPAGPYWFGVQRQGAWSADNAGDVMQQIKLSVGETRVLDFGSTTPATQWTGVVRNAAGEPVHGPGTLHVTNRADDGYAEFKFDEHGAFRAELQPGTYGIAVSLAYREDIRRLAAPDLRVELQDTKRDIQITGTRVVGDVTDAATGLPRAGEGIWKVGLRPTDNGFPRCAVPVDATGHFVLDGLAPGTYRVTSNLLRLAEGAQELVITDHDVQLNIQVSVQPR